MPPVFRNYANIARKTGGLSGLQREAHLSLSGWVEFILTQADSQRVFPNREIYGYGEDAYVITQSQQELQDEFEKKGVKIIQRLHKTDYHSLEFSIEDIDGRWICFGIKQA